MFDRAPSHHGYAQTAKQTENYPQIVQNRARSDLRD